MASGDNSGVTNCGQTSFEQQETEQIMKEIEREIEEHYKYLREELPKTSPIPIPDYATIKDEHKKNGYDQVKYNWTDGEYNFESRWHTHTPGAPEYSKDTWVVERVRPGIGAGKNHCPRIHEVLIKGRGWVSWDEWETAKKERKRGKETKEQRELLDNGHWKA